MKMRRMIGFLGLFAAAAVQAQVAPADFLRITGFDPRSSLTWTNALAPCRPVYEVWWANSVSGPWQHLEYVTNTNALALDQPPEGAGASVFYRLTWVSADPITFDYAYDEGYGVTAVEGQLTLQLPNMASWSLYDTGLMIEERHPLGTSSGPVVFAAPGGKLRVYLRRMMDDIVYLEGALEPAGDCGYTRFSGELYSITFSGGPDALGAFVAIAR